MRIFSHSSTRVRVHNVTARRRLLRRDLCALGSLNRACNSVHARARNAFLLTEEGAIRGTECRMEEKT